MITTYRNKEQPNFQQMVSQRECDIVWTTSVIQPLQETYSPSQMLQIILQKSRHFVSIGQIQIQFRPIIKYSSSKGPFGSLAQKMMTCVSAVQASDYLCLQSATVENNQLLSMTNFSLVKTRNQIQNVLNQLENVRKRDKMKPEHYDSGMISSSGVGSANTGFSQISITHPYAIPTSVPTGLAQTQASRFEFDAYPRAIIERQITYNADFSYLVPQGDNSTSASSQYFNSTLDANADVALDGGAPVLGQYPAIALQFTPSTCVYKEQQTRFAHFRQRWVTATVTPYSLPIITGTAATAAQYSKTAVVSNAVQPSSPAFVDAQQCVIFGQPVQGVFGGSQNTDVAGTFAAEIGLSYQQSAVGQSTARTVGTTSSTAGVYAPPELYTNCVVNVWETAIEFNPNLGGIDLMCLDSTQVVLQYNINRPENVLSAYLQDGLFLFNNTTASKGPSTAQCQTFLSCCLLGDTTFVLTDLCCRIPYYSYPDESAYAMVRELTYRPQSYYSLRQQIDPINSEGQFFSRLSIGGSSQLVGVFVMIVPQQAQLPTGDKTNVSDCKLNYLGMNPPLVGDLRCVASMDSYYVQMSDFYVQVANRRFTVNAIPISSPQFATYLATQANLETAFGKFLNIPLHHYVANRFCFFIPINPFGSESLVITDNQLIVSCSFDFASRKANSAMYGESNTDIAGKFSLLSVAVTQQAMVDCSYVRIM